MAGEPEEEAWQERSKNPFDYMVIWILIFAIVNMSLASYLTAKYVQDDWLIPLVLVHTNFRALLVVVIVCAALTIVGTFSVAGYLEDGPREKARLITWVYWSAWTGCAVWNTVLFNGTLAGRCFPEVKEYFPHCGKVVGVHAISWVICCLFTVLFMFSLFRRDWDS